MTLVISMAKYKNKEPVEVEEHGIGSHIFRLSKLINGTKIKNKIAPASNLAFVGLMNCLKLI